MVDQLHQNKHLRTSLDSAFQTEQCLKIPCGEKGKFTIIVSFVRIVTYQKSPFTCRLSILPKEENCFRFDLICSTLHCNAFKQSFKTPLLITFFGIEKSEKPFRAIFPGD